MHWHILGNGAMGCLWCARLALGAEKITLLVRHEAALATLRRQGGVSVTVDGKTSRTPVDAELSGTGPPIRGLLVCVKAHQTLAAVNDVSGRLTAGSRLVFMQNGMGQIDEIAGRYPGLEFYPAVTTEGVWRREPFSVVHAGRGETWLGPYVPETSVTQPADLMSSLRASGLTIRWDPDIVIRQWHKLAVNCVVNPLTALLGCHNGALLGPESEKPISDLGTEIERVIRARGAASKIPLREMVRNVLRATAYNRSSMLQDLEAGRETEIDYITGFLLREAEKLGIAAPANRLCVDLVRLKQAVGLGGSDLLRPE